MPTNEEYNLLKAENERLLRDKNILGMEIEIEILLHIVKDLSQNQRDIAFNDFISSMDEHKQNHYKNVYDKIRFVSR